MGLLEQFIHAIRHLNGRKPSDHRLALDGVFWIARTGAPWRDLPEEFGSSVYRQFRRWTLAGLWRISWTRNDAREDCSALRVIPMRKLRKAVDMTIHTLRNMVERSFK